MNWETVGNSYKIVTPYATALKLIRSALLKQNLHISTEFDAYDIARGSVLTNPVPCRILCVDCPLLLLKAMSLDPAAAVFLPLHVVISADGPDTQVYWLNLANIQGKRLPVGAVLPLCALQARMRMAMETLPMSAESRLEMNDER